MGNKLNRPMEPIHPPALHVTQAPIASHYIWLWVSLGAAALAFALITFYMYCMDNDDKEDRSGMLAFPSADWNDERARRKDNIYDETPKKDKDDDVEKAKREDEEYQNPDVLIGNAELLLKSSAQNQNAPMSFGVGSYIPNQTMFQLSDEKDRKLWAASEDIGNAIRQTSVDVHEQEDDDDMDIRKDSIFHSYDIFARRRPRRLSQDSGTGELELDGGGDILEESPSKDVAERLEKEVKLFADEETLDGYEEDLKELPALTNPKAFHGYLHLTRGYSIVSDVEDR